MAGRHHHLEASGGVDGRLVERRHVHAGNLRQPPQPLSARRSLAAGLGPLQRDFGQALLAIADQGRVHEPGQWFHVGGSGTSNQDEWFILTPLLGAQRDASELQHGQDVGVGEFVL